MVALTGGNRDYLNGHFRYGGTWNGTGLLLDATRKQGDGARDNTNSELNDFTFKMLTALGAQQTLSLKANFYGEDSMVGYSGLRLDEWNANARQNPFRNDTFDGHRAGLAASHIAAWSPAFVTTTNVYYSAFSRDWWRQSSNSAQRPNRVGTPGCAGMADLLTTCGNEGRLRHYNTWGVEPRGRWFGSLLGVRSELDFGVRAHFEIQDRRQMNGALPTARTGTIVEDNQRRTRGYSGFLQNRFLAGKWTITPGLRLEHVRFQRTNRLFNNGLGVFGNAKLTQAIPGIGVAYAPTNRITLFSGIHRGFAPPRAEDIVNNNGGFVELDPELSWNTEAGVRARLTATASVDATYFRMAYANQVIPASLAGGVGATLTSAGRTRNEGVELSGRYEARAPAGNTLFLRGAWTWLPVARFEGLRYSAVAGQGGVRVTGNRLPYAPATLLQGTAGVRHRGGVNGFLEMVHTGRQFGDDLNTVNPTADGQRGALPGNVIWNATLNVPFEAKRTTAFFTVKNLFDRLALVDRVRGMLPASPRLVQAGLRFDF